MQDTPGITVTCYEYDFNDCMP